MTDQLFTIKEGVLLDCGQQLSPINIAYHTYGKLNKEKDNVVLICHPLTANSDAITWWSNVVGVGLPIDTSRYFVICTNILGGCKGSTGPTSINPDTNEPYLLAFPIITVSDMVRCQIKLIDHLQIDTIKMVIGGSLGGMQALEWVAQAPKRVKSCVPIASTVKTSPLAIAFDSVGRQSILEQLKLGKGESGLMIARQLGHITYLSEEAMEQKFSRELQDSDEYQYTLNPEFQVESYLNHQGKKFISRFDLYSYLIITKAVSYFDLERYYGSFSNCFEKALARFLVLSISSDWLYTPQQSKALAFQLMALNKNVSYVEINSNYGHDTFLIDSDETKDVISCFLDSL